MTNPRWLLISLLALSLLGCRYQTREVRNSWSILPADPRQPQNAGPAGPLDVTEGWAIHLKTFTGSNRRAKADKLANTLARDARVPDVWVLDGNGRQAHVYRGRYGDPNTPYAQQDLRQTRQIELDGQRPFADVQLVALGPGGQQMAAGGPLDLRQHFGMYSLQIAFYDEQFGPDFRKAAEKAAEAIRADGDEAYYYHGPNRSLVTIGVFTEDDLIPQGPIQVYSPRVKEIQKKYPYNLGNGVTLIEKRPGQKDRPQPSFLVKVSQ